MGQRYKKWASSGAVFELHDSAHVITGVFAVLQNLKSKWVPFTIIQHMPCFQKKVTGRVSADLYTILSVSAVKRGA